MDLPRRIAAAGLRRTPLARRASLDFSNRRVDELESRLDHERLYPLEWVHRRIRDAFGYRVLEGPFEGLEYPEDLAFRIEAYSSKLLGTYEQELHAAIVRLTAAPVRIVVNVGASDGYYAIGLARRLPTATVHAFDTNTDHHALLEAVARANRVADRVIVRGECNHETLDELVSESLLVADCEGCEHHLLDPEKVDGLRTARMLIECHDLVVPGTTDVLVERFGGTHDLELIPTTPRWPSDHPELAFLPLVTQQLAIQEFREGPMQWMIATPRSS